MDHLDLDKWGKENEVAMKEREAGDFYKLKEGANKVRIVSPFYGVSTINRGGKYMGIVTQNNSPQEDDTVSYKGWAWALIRETNELKIVQLSKTILGHIYSLKKDTDYAFTDYPMPYDITITAIGAGKKEVQYSVQPARANTEVTEEEMASLNKKKSIPDIITAMVNKQNGGGAKIPEATNPSSYPKSEGEVGF